MSTRRPALHALALVVCAACDSASSPTEIMVVVDSDLDVPAVLSHVDVAVYAADGRGERLGARSFALVSDASGGGASNAFPLPLSFALAPAGEGAARSFRLAVTGSVLRSGALTKIVDTALVASFAPGRALRLDVFLSRGCADASCSNDASGVAITTCVAPGTCVPVPMRAPLPPYEGGPLGGYTPALPVGSDAGSVVEPPVGSDAGVTRDGGSPGADAGADAGGVGADAAIDAGTDAGADAGVDAGSCPPGGCVCDPGSVSNGTLCVDLDECSDPAAIATCLSTGYPCEESQAPGFTCRGHRADWPMPDSVDGAPVKPSYTSVGSGENLVVTDAVTGLEWQGRPGRDNGAALTFEAAQSYCAALNIGTRSQFRLPSQVELASILDTTRSGTSVLLLADRLFLGLATAYWTSTPDPLSPALHRLVSFADGSVASAPASTATARVRCVRSPTPVPSGTPAKRLAPIRVADKRQVLGYRDVRTGIGWALQTSATPLDYAGALAYCQSLGAAGAVGGRLPTYKELLTALDLGPTAPFVDAELAATSGGTFWSASSAPGDTTRAYVVDFTSATGTAQPVTATAYARCVSAGTP